MKELLVTVLIPMPLILLWSLLLMTCENKIVCFAATIFLGIALYVYVDFIAKGD